MDLLKLGIDWQSILFYVVNYGILFAFLGYYVIPKLISKLEIRQKNIADNIEEANRLKNNFQQKYDELQQEKEAFERSVKEEYQKMQKAFDQKQEAMIAEIEAKRKSIIAETQAMMDQKQSMIMAETEAKTMTLIKSIILHILQNKIDANIIEESVKEAWKVHQK